MPRASSLRPIPLVLALALGAIGCDSERIAMPPVSPPPASTPPAPPPVVIPGLRLDVSFLPPALVVGTRVSPYVSSYVQQWTEVALPPLTWQTTNRNVLAIDGTYERGALLRAVGPGTATIIITGGGATKQVVVVVHPVPNDTTSNDSSGVVVSDFHFLTYSEGGDGAYVPQLTMQARDGFAYDVLRVQFVIPGLPPLHTCSSVRPVAASPTSLFNESYGDWELYYTTVSRPDSGARATAIIDLRRSSGGMLRMVVDGPLVPGGPPTTFTGGAFTPWSCG